MNQPDHRLTSHHSKPVSPTAETDRLRVATPSLLRRDIDEGQWRREQKAMRERGAARSMFAALCMVESLLAAHANCPKRHNVPCQDCRALLTVRAAIAEAAEVL